MNATRWSLSEPCPKTSCTPRRPRSSPTRPLSAELSIRLLDRREKEIGAELSALAKSEQPLAESVELLCSLPGVGLLTAVTVLGETDGFELMRNKRQLASYAGLDVVEKLSGTSVRGKPGISKRGKRYLRKAMHMPALTAIRHDDRFKGLFVRLVGKHGVKRKAVVAVQRKLLEMMYTIYKSKKPYERDHLEKRQTDQYIAEGQPLEAA